MFDVYINDKSCKEFGILPVRRPNIPAPTKKYKEYDIPGRDGKLYEDTKTYDDIEITIDFNYISDKNKWHDVFRLCKKVFLNAKKLQLYDDIEYYHIIKKIIINTNERISMKIGKFSVTFTLDPYYYKISGSDKYDYEDVIFNNCDISKPIYFIKGEGICYLVVNGSEVKCNVGQNLTINTFLELSYREDGSLQNTSINGDYKDLYLIEGKNEISITEGFDLKIIPNWRCI